LKTILKLQTLTPIDVEGPEAEPTTTVLSQLSGLEC
jgi:hypothetical protein